MERSGILTGTAGVYHVASQLAARGFHAAPTFGNAPFVDLIVGSVDGSATLSVQVKTTINALRTRGRGQNKHPDHYEWDVGKKSAQHYNENLFFAFVDLKNLKAQPDVFIIPSKVIAYSFDTPYFKQDKNLRWRYHPKVNTISTYKNNWEIIENNLNK